MLLFVLLLAFVALSAGLAWYLISHDRGAKEPTGALWIAAGFGVVGALAAGLIESKLISPDNLLTGMPTNTILATAMLVGLIEELCKFVPLAFFIYKRPYFNEHTDGVIYFALAGLAFGLPENILYTIQFGEKAGLTRLMLTPLFHAAVTGMVGYYLAKGKLDGKPALMVALPLMTAIILHGLYDFGLASGAALYGMMALSITLGLSALLFLYYQWATNSDQDDGLSATGHNDFCRSCGQPNPHNNLYCVQCGQNA